MPKEYKVISAKALEHLVDDLNSLEDGWVIVAYTQEFAVTKLLLEKET